MKWNLDNIGFLHQPDIFTGTFDIAKMQARHEQEMREKLEGMKADLERQADPLAAMKTLNVRDQFQFFLNNEGTFRAAERFEEAVLALHGRLNAPFASGGDPAVWNGLFAACDPTRLYRLGIPVSFSTATVYRGSLSGFQRGLSWTPERQRAEGFAERWHDPSQGGGEVFEVDVSRGNVLVYLQHRHETEVILAPEFIGSAAIRPFLPGR
jgi:hypothetical protein